MKADAKKLVILKLHQFVTVATRSSQEHLAGLET
jgi:hypothetical protein